MKTTFNVEFGGHTIESKEIVAAAKKIWTDDNRKVKDLSKIDLYIKPEENKVYYVFNEDESGDFDLF